MADTTTAQLQHDLQIYFAKKVLRGAEFQTVLDQFGHKETLPEASSKTIQFTRYSDLDIVTNPLTEGQAPAGSQLTTSAINAVVDQYGDFVTLTDLAKLTPKHSSVQNALKKLSEQSSKSYDRAINKVIIAGTAVRYANSKTARNLLADADKLTWADVRKEVSRLRTAGAPTFKDGNYVLVVDPAVEQDLMDDEAFRQTVYRQASKEKSNELYKGELVSFAGVTVVRSNNLITDKGASNAKVHISLLFGEDAYGNTDLQHLEVYKEGPGGVSDPLHQKMTLGWKFAAKAAILNNNFMCRLESGSLY